MTSSVRALEWMREGENYEQKQKVPAAIRAFEHAARSPDPEIAAGACYHLGLLHERRHHITAAARAFREATRAGDVETRAGAYYHLGRIYEHKHLLSDAYATYLHAARLGGRDSSRARRALHRLWPEAG